MRGIAGRRVFICTRCSQANSARSLLVSGSWSRNASNSATPPKADGDGEQSRPQKEGRQEGALSRRLSQMSEENIETGGRSAVKAVEEAGFSEELKSRLMEKISNANASFRNENPAAFAEVEMPPEAGKGTRDIAGARPWTGQEATEDTALRMLDDAHKPLRVPVKPPVIRGPQGAPSRIDTGRPKKKPGTGVRLASARDRASSYERVKGSSLSEEEREKFREGMKARFQPGARAITSLQGLASLANERIEDAIARGQFKNLPRGKRLERDHNANSPFIDTTEYLMNKMIQKQDIVPPWIEKQQELMSAASRFRGRLRADWKRHVARMISSKGGSLENQTRLAEEYALAEAIENPPKKKKEVKLNAIDATGHLSQITLAGELKVTPPEVLSADEDDARVENEIKIMEQTFNDDGTLKSQPDAMVTISTEEPAQLPEAIAPERISRKPTVPPFRDPQWMETERAYLTAAIESLNSMARSYNLMAPPIARKPYYYLDRELKACFAEVAPQIASAIRERSGVPKVKGVEVTGRQKTGSVLHQFSTAQSGHVHDDQKPLYGFKEFWRDLFTGPK